MYRVSAVGLANDMLQVAPCECKGDTRYVHLNCLQKWHTTTSENKVSEPQQSGASVLTLNGRRRQCCLKNNEVEHPSYEMEEFDEVSPLQPCVGVQD